MKVEYDRHLNNLIRLSEKYKIVVLLVKFINRNKMKADKNILSVIKYNFLKKEYENSLWYRWYINNTSNSKW